ncbi:MAG: betaine/proline/choline family ABC transporter ATP-binding protein [Chloroflexota bacterium]|nr:betaine/proline/choline family ABC transporter ATP-binding protein [Chloroflexota bacterium]
MWKVFGENPEVVLEPENRSKSPAEIQSEFGQIAALRDVSFNVNHGETFVIMGLSGSGKSTLVRCLIRLVEATSGQIFVDQEDVTLFDEGKLREFRRSKVSMVFQHFGLLPHRNVIDNACYGLEIKGVEKDERYNVAQQMIDMVGLKGWEDSRVSELSGGMQQRVGLARALAMEPEILLMDEPFSGLDPLIRRQMRHELAELQRQIHKTLVFITHDLDEAITVGDRIAIMRDGEIIQLGTPEEIILNPLDEFVSEFTEDVSKERVLNLGSVCVEPDLILTLPGGIDQLKAAMDGSGVEYAVCVDETESVLGVTSRSLVETAERDEDIEQLLTKPLSQETNIQAAIPKLADSEIPIPIVGPDSKLVGIITQKSILRALSS